MTVPTGAPVAPSNPPRTATWVIIVVVIVVLCCSCVGIAGLLFAFGPDLLHELGISFSLPLLGGLA